MLILVKMLTGRSVEQNRNHTYIAHCFMTRLPRQLMAKESHSLDDAGSTGYSYQNNNNKNPLKLIKLGE